MLHRFPARLWLLLLIILLLTGCASSQPGATTAQPPSTDRPGTTEAAGRQTAPAPEPEPTRETTQETTVVERQENPAYGYTYGKASGNRVVEGTGGLPDSDPVDVRLDGTPAWVVGVPLEDGTAWVVALEDGRVQAFRLTGPGEAEPIGVSPEQLPPDQPPLVKAQDGSLELVVADDPRASDLTHPVPVAPDGEGLVGVESGGRLFLEPAGSLPVFAPPDARLVRSAGGNLAVLSGPTGRYQHGVLGDAVEADSVMVLRPGAGNRFEPAGVVRPRSGGVFETVAPLWFDAPGEDRQLLAVTESAPEVGTRVAVYGAGGELRAAGPFIGEPMRWRHLLAAGPFGPDGAVKLVAVRTPHLGGVVEFYALDLASGELEITATVPGYTSHRIGSRNLDTARAGDFDGDGRWELLVPSEDYTALGAIRHEEAGAAVAWTLPAGGTIVTNLASATDAAGRASVAAGRSDSVLRIWP